MISKTYAIVILVIEVLLFIVEVLLASRNRANRLLRHVENIDELDFIDLKQGCRTSISIFRISLFVAYLVLVILYFDTDKSNLIEPIFLYFIGGVLMYMLSLMNIKTFIFYTDYFIVSEPFNFFRREILVSYSAISDFKLYRALYNNFFLKLKLKNGEVIRIQFSGSSIPKNNLILRMILNSKTGLRMNYKRKGWIGKRSRKMP
jgi:hypothetical protein